MSEEDSQKPVVDSWNASGKGVLRPGYASRELIRIASDQRLQHRDIWIARDSEPREAALNTLLKEAATQTGIAKPPRLVMFRSVWPQAVEVNDKYLAVSTSLAELLPPEQMKAMMEQQLETHKHQTPFFTKYVLDYAIVFGSAAGIHKLASLKWKNLKLRWDVKSLLTTGAFLGAAKFVGWESLERWKDRKHGIEQDAAVARFTGGDTMLGALEAIGQREKELEHSGEPRKITHALPEYTKKTADIGTRIAALKKNVPESFAARAAASAQGESYTGKG